MQAIDSKEPSPGLLRSPLKKQPSGFWLRTSEMDEEGDCPTVHTQVRELGTSKPEVLALIIKSSWFWASGTKHIPGSASKMGQRHLPPEEEEES